MVGIVAIGVALATAGCGTRARPGTARLEGTITIGGQQLPTDANANLAFRPMSGGRSAGAAVTNGKYICKDAPMGKVKVCPSIERPTGRMLVESDNRPYPEVASIIASKYALGIDIEVAGDETKLDFDLEPAEL